jgi:hypothetical protein
MFAEEYLTGHYRPMRDDERQRCDQLVVVMLAFVSASCAAVLDTEGDRPMNENRDADGALAGMTSLSPDRSGDAGRSATSGPQSLSAAGSSPADSHPNTEQIAWLVALGSSTPQWWTGRGDVWTDAVDGTQRNPARCAIRFARKEDAERAIGWLVKEGTRDGCKAEEHLWL